MNNTKVEGGVAEPVAAVGSSLDLIQLALAHVEAENVHDADLTLSTIADDGAIYKIYGSGQAFNSRKEIHDFYAGIMSGVPDMNVEIHNIIKDDARRQVFAQYKFTGTHTGILWGLAPTGKKIEYHGAILYEFDEKGKLTREETYFDKSEALASLGVIKDPNTELGAFLWILPQSPILLFRSLLLKLFGEPKK